MHGALGELDDWFLSWAEDRVTPIAQDSKETAAVEAFALLAHAQVERYLEAIIEVCLDAVLDRADLLNDATACPAMVSLAWQMNAGGAPRVRLGQGDTFLLRQYGNRLRRIIRDNNGIKATNLGRLVEPFGLAVTDFGALLHAELTEAGRSRGDIAHGATIGVATPVNALDEANRYVRILAELPRLEHGLMELL